MTVRWLSLAFALTLAPAAAAAPPELCERLAAHARQVAARPGDAARTRASDYGLLADRIRSRPAPKGADDDEAFHARVGKALQIDSIFSLEPVAGDLWRAESIQGTANCTYDWFLRRKADGSIVEQPRPDAFADLCWTSSRELALVDGRLALVETDERESPFLVTDVEITPWDNGWKPACKVSLRFADTFRVTERFCTDKALCAAGAPLAVRLARALARDPSGKTLPQASPPPRLSAGAARRAVAAVRNGPGSYSGFGVLETFGAKARTEYPQYSSSEFALVTLHGRPAVAHVGVGGVGWRTIGDHLVVFYSAEPRPKPLASFVVARASGGLTSATASTPEPYRAR